MYPEVYSYCSNKNIELVVVSKTQSLQKIEAIYNQGHRVFAENKVQELLKKSVELPNNIEWHMIGHLQTNKVKLIVPFVTLIQSVDSEKVLKEINKQAKKFNRKINVLLQAKIATETRKFGLSKDDLFAVYNDYSNGEYPHIQVNGLMGMATFTSDKSIVKQEFLRLKLMHQSVIDSFQLKQPFILSMGMSQDFKLAIDCGSTMVRIGSLLFGPR